MGQLLAARPVAGPLAVSLVAGRLLEGRGPAAATTESQPPSAPQRLPATMDRADYLNESPHCLALVARLGTQSDAHSSEVLNIKLLDDVL